MEDNGNGRFRFIELKVKTNTPLFAAVEILLYGVLYLWTRRRMNDLGYDGAVKRVLAASAISLVVLAPSDYYKEYKFPDLERAIGKGLEAFIMEDGPGAMMMDFGFKSFEFVPPPYSTESLDALLLTRNPVYPQVGR